MIFLENKKKKLSVFIFLLFIIGGIGLFFTDVRFAYARPCNNSVYDIVGGCYYDNYDINKPISSLATPLIDTGLSSAGQGIVDGLKWLVYWMVFVPLGWLASLATIIFAWVINPDHVSGKSGILNLHAVYEMWQFVRDFFNLFFILVLLYIAFTVVFQIQKNFKQMILSLIIAALLVNFSFPISRFVIDATNVPMYFFANQIFENTNKNGGAFGSALDVSKLQNILIPANKETGKINFTNLWVSRLFMAVVFMFMFSITLLVLAVMFIIRLIALIILVIFSSVGFVATIIPGMDKYSKMWWDNFWKYALFGPAAMLVLLIAVHFFVAIGDENGTVFKGLRGVSTSAISGSDDPTFFASMVMFSIPIILLWMTIGLGQTMAIAGGATISGYGHQFAAWAGKKMSGYSALKRNWDSYSAARKKRTDEKNKNNWGGGLANRLNRAQDTVYGATGLPGSAAAQQRVKDMQNKEISEKAEEHKKNQTDRAILADHLKSKDVVKRKAAALALAEHPEGITSPEQLSRALAAVSDNKTQYAKVLKSANEDAMNMSVDQIQEVVAQRDAKGAIMRDSTGKIIEDRTKLKDAFSKMKKEGQAGAMVEYRASEIRDAAGNVTKVAENRGDVVLDVLKSIGSAKDKVKQESLFRNKANDPGIMSHVSFLDPQVRQELEKVAAQESQDAHRVIKGMPTWNSSSSSQSPPPKPKIDFSKLGSSSPKYDSKTGTVTQ